MGRIIHLLSRIIPIMTLLQTYPVASDSHCGFSQFLIGDTALAEYNAAISSKHIQADSVAGWVKKSMGDMEEAYKQSNRYVTSLNRFDLSCVVYLADDASRWKKLDLELQSAGCQQRHFIKVDSARHLLSKPIHLRKSGGIGKSVKFTYLNTSPQRIESEHCKPDAFGDRMEDPERGLRSRLLIFLWQLQQESQ